MINLILLWETFTNSFRAEMLDVASLFAIFCAILVIVSKNPVLLWEKLSNSGYLLKLLIPSHSWKWISGWVNHSCMVITQLIIERLMDDRGSKSAKSKVVVKEQRVYGSYFGLVNPKLRCTLTGLERDYLIKYSYGLCSSTHVSVAMTRVSNQISRSVLYSSLRTQPEINLNTNSAQTKPLGKMDPFFLTGFTDGEGSFSLQIRSNDYYTSKWKVQYSFQVGIHTKDIAILESMQLTLGVGKIYTMGKEGVQFRVESLKDLSIIVNHFNEYPLQTKKQLDFKLFKLALSCVKNKEHLTPEGLFIKKVNSP